MKKSPAQKTILIVIVLALLALGFGLWSGQVPASGHGSFRAYGRSFSVPKAGVKIVCREDIDVADASEASAGSSDIGDLDSLMPDIARSCGDNFNAQLYYGNGMVYDLQGRRNSKFSSDDTYLVTLLQELGPYDPAAAQGDLALWGYSLEYGQEAPAEVAVYSTKQDFKKVYHEDLGMLPALGDIWWEEPIEFEDVNGDGRTDAKVLVPMAASRSLGYRVLIAEGGSFVTWTLANKDPDFSFSVRGGVPYGDGEPLAGADGESFVIFNYQYAKDRNRVYGDGGPFDAATFAALDPNGDYVKDKNGAYYEGYLGVAGLSGHTPIEGADPETFEWVNESYVKDRNRVYHIIWPTEEGEDPATFVRVPEPGTNSTNWTKDRNRVYHDGKTVAGADPKTFRAFNFEFGTDAANLFFRNTLVPGADAATFELIHEQHPSYAKDRNRVYYGEEFEDKPVIEGADPATFVLFYEGEYDLPTGYAKDKDHVYYETKLIPGADPATFDPEEYQP